MNHFPFFERNRLVNQDRNDPINRNYGFNHRPDGHGYKSIEEISFVFGQTINCFSHYKFRFLGTTG